MAGVVSTGGDTNKTRWYNNKCRKMYKKLKRKERQQENTDKERKIMKEYVRKMQLEYNENKCKEITRMHDTHDVDVWKKRKKSD